MTATIEKQNTAGETFERILLNKQRSSKFVFDKKKTNKNNNKNGNKIICLVAAVLGKRKNKLFEKIK